MDRIVNSDTAKHVVDAVAIPGGILAAFASYVEVINLVLASMVLMTSLIWGIYRIIDMRAKIKIRENGEGNKT